MLTLSVLDQSPIPSGGTPADAIANTIHLAKRCEALGYHRYWVAEHHSSSALAGSVPEVLLARLGAETSTMRIGSGGVMLSHYAPLKVAEAFRLLEVMYPGRIDLGIGRAPGSDQVTSLALAKGPAIGADENFPNDVVDVVRWLHDDVEPHHRFARVRAMPTGPTAPVVWLLGSSDYSAMCAAHLGLPFSFAHFIAPDGGERVMAAYRTRFRPSSLLAEPVGSVGCSVVCAPTDEEAEWLAAPLRLWRLRLYSTGDPGPIPTPEDAARHAYSARETMQLRLMGNRLVAGSPSTCRAALEELAVRYSVTELVIVTIVHDHAKRVRSYELLAESFSLAAPVAAASP